MFNYLRSESYRIRHSRSFILTIGCLAGLLLLALIFARYSIISFGDHGMGNLYLSFLYTEAQFFAPLVFVIGGVLEDDEFKKHHTLKSSVAFGFSRLELYIGKLLAHLFYCTLTYLFLALFYALAGMLFLGVPDPDSLQMYIRMLLGAYPLCVAIFTMSFCFFFNMGTGWGGAMSAIGVTYGLPYLFLFLGQKFFPLQIPAVYNPVGMLQTQISGNNFSNFWDTASGMGSCYLTAAIYILIFSLIGFYWFKKREVR